MEPRALRGSKVVGRQEWFGKALIAQLPALRRYARALSGNMAQADDLVQDTIERALRQGEGLRDLQRIASWLRSILHNLYINLYQVSKIWTSNMSMMC